LEADSHRKVSSRAKGRTRGLAPFVASGGRLRHPTTRRKPQPWPYTGGLLPYCSFGWSSPRPSGEKSNRFQTGQIESTCRGSWPGSKGAYCISVAKVWRTAPPFAGEHVQRRHLCTLGILAMIVGIVAVRGRRQEPKAAPASFLGEGLDAGDGRFGDHHQARPLVYVLRLAVEGVQDGRTIWTGMIHRGPEHEAVGDERRLTCKQLRQAHRVSIFALLENIIFRNFTAQGQAATQCVDQTIVPPQLASRACLRADGFAKCMQRACWRWPALHYQELGQRQNEKPQPGKAGGLGKTGASISGRHCASEMHPGDCG
jgi:hypothetical protein